MTKETQIVQFEELVTFVHNRNPSEPLFIRISDELEAYVVSDEVITDEDIRRSERSVRRA